MGSGARARYSRAVARERVIVAMSGGVDSTLAAAVLHASGAEVVGVTLHLWDYPDDGSVKGRCCAPEDVHDARRVADYLGIPHYAFDRRELFRKEVVDPFVDAYLSGTTPSPCVRCNRGVKVRELLHLADSLGADAVATGHYARVAGPEPHLLRGRDTDKDQSYFLHMLGPDTLRRLRFPLGDLTKTQVRAEAERLGLPGATKGESQELCFVPTGRYDAFVDARAGDRVRPGPVVDATGAVVGQHDGVHRFTPGQRKNLGVALGYRAFVVQVDASSGSVQLGTRTDARMDALALDEVALHVDATIARRCQVVTRYRQAPVPATVEFSGSGRAEVVLQHPVDVVAPGQYAVFYDGDRVLGGGLITGTRLSRVTHEPLEATL